MSSLDRLRELEKAATPGPWEAYKREWWLIPPPAQLSGLASTRTDADLIVTIRNALPALLDVVEAAAAARACLSKPLSFSAAIDAHGLLAVALDRLEQS